MLDGKSRNRSAIITPPLLTPVTQAEIDEIKIFLWGAVYEWYKNHKSGDKFTFNTFMGGNGGCWQDTPLISLYQPNPKAPVPQGKINLAMTNAAMDGGLLLKCVLEEYNGAFTTVNPGGSPKEYAKV